jgi:hypothetical protein
LLPVLLVFLVAEFTGEGRVSARHRAGVDSARCSFVPACGSGVLLLGWMFVGVQVSFLLLRASSVGLWEFFFRPLVVVLAVVNLVLTGFGDEVVDVRSMLKLWLDRWWWVAGSCGGKLRFGFFVESGESFCRFLRW